MHIWVVIAATLGGALVGFLASKLVVACGGG